MKLILGDKDTSAEDMADALIGAPSSDDESDEESKDEESK